MAPGRPWTAAVAAAAAVLSGCSPYVYKAEVAGFSEGVRQLASAYSTGLREVAQDRADGQIRRWKEGRAKLVLTEGCVLSVAAAPAAATPCALREVGQPVPGPRPAEAQAAAAAPTAKALADYAAALAAVTSAEDRQALDAAQAGLRRSIDALARQADPASADRLGAVADLFAAGTAAALDARRYRALKAGVSAAREPVAVLGPAMGEALDTLRAARADELRLATDRLGAGLGPGLEGGAYAARLDALQARVAALEALRRAEPRKAAAELVAAHEALAAALADDRRQVEAVSRAVRDFAEKAGAVRAAFAGEPAA